MKHIKHMKEIGPLVIQAPAELDTKGRRSVFLGGTIDDGRSADWQSALTRMVTSDVAVLNPRRPEWNPDASRAEIERQIEWEMDAMDSADLIVFYFAPGSKSPVTMLELGRYAATGKCVVYCPDGFWRKVNVDVFCRRCGVRTVDSIESLSEIINGL